MTDSTIAHPQNQQFYLTNVSWLFSTQGMIQWKTKCPIYFLVCKGLSIDDVGVSRETVLQETRPGAGFETADFSLKKSWGGYRRTTQMKTFPWLTVFRCYGVIVGMDSSVTSRKPYYAQRDAER